jgi:peptide-methionine (S)-S-oxide reductase
MDDVKQMTATAGKDELLVALTTAAFYGKPDVIAYLLSVGAPANGYPENNNGFHSHATPLHQAIYSGSLQSVKLLVEAGASLHAPDKIYEGTPLGWAIHMENDADTDEEAKQKFREIATYLRGR